MMKKQIVSYLIISIIYLQLSLSCFSTSPEEIGDAQAVAIVQGRINHFTEENANTSMNATNNSRTRKLGPVVIPTHQAIELHIPEDVQPIEEQKAISIIPPVNILQDKPVPLAPTRRPAVAIQPALPKVSVAKQHTIKVITNLQAEDAREGISQIRGWPIRNMNEQPILPNNNKFDVYNEPHHDNISHSIKKEDEKTHEFGKRNNFIKKDDGSDQYS